MGNWMAALDRSMTVDAADDGRGSRVCVGEGGPRRGLWFAWASLVCFMVSGCSETPTIAPERVVEVKRGGIVRGVIAVGRVEPRTRVEVKSKAGGILQKLNVDVNEPVRVGQVIAELDREILQARVDESEARLRQARSDLNLSIAEIARLAVEKEDPEVKFARRNWERVQALEAGGIASEDELDLARQRFEKAEYQLRLLDAQSRIAEARVQAAEGRVSEVEAQTELARQELKEATILSPIDGVVLYRYLEEGDSVSSIRVAGGNATTIMTLGDLSELYVDGEIDEVDVGDLLTEQKSGRDLTARITVESLGGRPVFGRVNRLTPLGLEDSNGIVTFEVRIAVENRENRLLANMTANAMIILEEKEDVVLVSQGALITEAGERFVLVHDAASGRPVRRKVETGISDGSQVEILSGLAEGDRIVIP